MSTCTPHVCKGHDSKHIHGENCGHTTVKHDDHVDYIVIDVDGGHRHNVHGNHCDDHGKA